MGITSLTGVKNDASSQIKVVLAPGSRKCSPNLVVDGGGTRQLISSSNDQKMSLPGLQLNSTPVEQQKSSSTYELRGDTEWRFEVEFGQNVEIKVCWLIRALFYLSQIML